MRRQRRSAQLERELHARGWGISPPAAADQDEALAAYRESLELPGTTGTGRFLAETLAGIAGVAVARGQRSGRPPARRGGGAARADRRAARGGTRHARARRGGGARRPPAGGVRGGLGGGTALPLERPSPRRSKTPIRRGAARRPRARPGGGGRPDRARARGPAPARGGPSDREIAAALFSPSASSVESRTAAAVFAHRHGLA